MKTITDFTTKLKSFFLPSREVAPIEDGTSVVGDYSIGKQFIRNSNLYKAKTAITHGTVWSNLTLGTNYEAADDVSSQIQALSNQVDSIIQESVFTIEEEDGVLYLDWHGASGECPYSTRLNGTDYELIFTYETA